MSEDRPLLEALQTLARLGKGPALRTYRSHLNRFETWCRGQGLVSWPTADATLSAFLANIAGSYHSETLKRIISAVCLANQLKGTPFNPAGSYAVLEGIMRVHGAARRPYAALRGPEVINLAKSCAPTVHGLRDRALLLLGYCGGLSSQEIVGLDYLRPGPNSCGHLKILSDGIHLEVIKPADFRTGARRVVKVLPRREGLCPSAAIEGWLAVAGNADGPLLRRIGPDHRVSTERLPLTAPTKLVRSLVLKADLVSGTPLDEARVRSRLYAMVSLRSGFIADALAAGLGEVRIATHLGYTSTQILRLHRRRHAVVSHHPARAVFRTMA